MIVLLMLLAAPAEAQTEEISVPAACEPRVRIVCPRPPRPRNLEVE